MDSRSPTFPSIYEVCSRLPKNFMFNTMSPRASHRQHSNSSAELLKEIAALEVEIVNLERYLLSLYRTALQGHLPRFPGNSGNHIQQITGTSPFFASEKTNMEMPKNHSDHQQRSSPRSALAGPRDLVQDSSPKSLSGRERTSSYSRHRSLAAHFGNYHTDIAFICPDRLSEDIIKCISSIYCKLANPGQTHKGNSISSTSSFCSSSTFSPRNLSGSLSPQCIEEVSDHCDFGSVNEDNGPYSEMVEVLKISLDNGSYSYAATMLQKLRSLIRCLETIDLKKMRREEKLAFWINIHNALVMHAYLAYGTQNYNRTSSIEKASYNVSGHHINAYDIQSSILGIKSHYSAPWLQTLLSPGKKFMTGNTKHVHAIDYPEPLVHFALCSGTYHDPALRVYTAKHVFEDLKLAKEEFIKSTVYVHKQTKICLPKILCYYAKDASLSMGELLEVVSECLSTIKQKSVRNFIRSKPEKYIYWLGQSSSFRYLIHKDIA